MRRWVCPVCSAGVMGPERPRRDDVRRYCLPCSAKAGRLTERTCLALDRKRTEAKERDKRRVAQQRERRAKQREKRAAFQAERRYVMGLDLVALTRRWWRLKAMRTSIWQKRAPRLDVRLGDDDWRRRKQYITAHAHYDRHLITMTIPKVWVGAEPNPKHVAELQVTILHELAHHANPEDVPHGRSYNAILIAAARSLWGDEVAGLADTGTGYGPTRRIRERLAEALSKKGDPE